MNWSDVDVVGHGVDDSPVATSVRLGSNGPGLSVLKLPLCDEDERIVGTSVGHAMPHMGISVCAWGTVNGRSVSKGSRDTDLRGGFLQCLVVLFG